MERSRRPACRRVRRRPRCRPERRCADGGAGRHQGTGAHRAIDQGHRRDDGRRAAVPHRPGGRRLQHDRRRPRVDARHLRLELPWKECHCGGGARVRAHPGHRSTHSRQRRGAACGYVEQEGVLYRGRRVREDPRPPGLRQHRAGARTPRPGVRAEPSDLVAPLRARAATGSDGDGAGPLEPNVQCDHRALARGSGRRSGHPQRARVARARDEGDGHCRHPGPLEAGRDFHQHGARRGGGLRRTRSCRPRARPARRTRRVQE